MALGLNCTTITSVFLVTYFAFVIQQLYYILNPLSGVEIAGDLISPLWKDGDRYDIIGYISTTSKFQECNLVELRKNQQILFEKQQLIHTSNQSLLALDLVLTSNSSQGTSSLNEANINHEKAGIAHLPKKYLDIIHNNKSSIFFNFLLLKLDEDTSTGGLITKQHISSGKVLFGNVKMIKYDVIPRHFHHRYLLSDLGLVQQSEIAEQRQKLSTSTIISYWKPEVSVKLVSDFSDYPVHYVPMEIARNIVIKNMNNDNKKKKKHPTNQPKQFYKPSLYVDEIGLTSDKYIHLNNTVNELPIRISIGPMSTQRWHLISKIEESIHLSKNSLGVELSPTDLDDFRRMISDTSITLLTVSLIAALLHMLFEYLAFSSDIQFWKENKSLIGLSIRALFTDLISQVIIFLFLCDNNTSLLIIVPAFIAIVIQVWKIYRATGLRIRRKGMMVSFEFTRLQSNQDTINNDEISNKSKEDNSVGVTSSESNSNTIEKRREELEARLTQASLDADSFATKYLSLFFAPIIIAYVIYTLCYQQYAGWYSWAISSLTTCVYTFGFILMVPQLYINHQLKSVSFLPWQYLIYKFLNTFVDDLFAFIIKMPTMHRLSVFRDDIIFFIYLYQRWIYRVDKNRPTEK